MMPGDPPPLSSGVASGASDPMAISVESFERQFLDFGEAVRTGRKPLVSGEEGYQALALVDADLPVLPHRRRLRDMIWTPK